MDFFDISIRSHSERAKNKYTIEPEFKYLSKDLITKGGVVHGFWYEGKWRTELGDLIQIIDKQILNFAKDFKNMCSFSFKDAEDLYRYESLGGIKPKEDNGYYIL